MPISATERNDNGPRTLGRPSRPNSRLSRSKADDTSAKSGAQRVNKQEYLRAQGMLKFERTTCITPEGFRSVRLHPSSDTSNQMNKYLARPSTAIGMMSSQRSASSKKETEKRKSPEPVLSASPSSITNQRPSSSRSVIYNVRNFKCSPPEMYRHDNIRAAARETQGRLSRSSSGTRTSSGTASDYSSSVDLYSKGSSERSDIAYRFGEPIQRPKFVKSSPFLNHSDLSMGQKQYIWGIARVYSVDQLKRLRQKQYQETLNYEYTKRIITKKLEDTQKVKLWKEYLMYDEFIKRYATGLPRRQYDTRRQGTRSASHRHSCIPWLKTEEEPRTYPDRIILHDPGTRQSHESTEEDEILMSHFRPMSAPPDSLQNFSSDEDDELPNQIDSDRSSTHAEPRTSPTSPRTNNSDGKNKDAGTVVEPEKGSPASDDESRESPQPDLINDSADENEDEESDRDVESRSHTPYQAITEETEKLSLREPDENYL